MDPIRDEGHFKIYLEENILTAEIINTASVPSVNYHTLTQIFAAVQSVVAEHDLAKGGWYMLYDFSGLLAYEITAAMAFVNFSRWARSNGRRKAAHIFPTSKQVSEVSVIKRTIVSLVSQFSDARDDHYTAADRTDAMRWFAATLTPDSAETSAN